MKCDCVAVRNTVKTNLYIPVKIHLCFSLLYMDVGILLRRTTCVHSLTLEGANLERKLNSTFFSMWRSLTHYCF